MIQRITTDKNARAGITGIPASRDTEMEAISIHCAIDGVINRQWDRQCAQDWSWPPRTLTAWISASSPNRIKMGLECFPDRESDGWKEGPARYRVSRHDEPRKKSAGGVSVPCDRSRRRRERRPSPVPLDGPDHQAGAMPFPLRVTVSILLLIYLLASCAD